MKKAKILLLLSALGILSDASVAYASIQERGGMLPFLVRNAAASTVEQEVQTPMPEEGDFSAPEGEVLEVSGGNGMPAMRSLENHMQFFIYTAEDLEHDLDQLAQTGVVPQSTQARVVNGLKKDAPYKGLVTEYLRALRTYEFAYKVNGRMTRAIISTGIATGCTGDMEANLAYLAGLQRAHVELWQPLMAYQQGLIEVIESLPRVCVEGDYMPSFLYTADERHQDRHFHPLYLEEEGISPEEIALLMQDPVYLQLLETFFAASRRAVFASQAATDIYNRFKHQLSSQQRTLNNRYVASLDKPVDAAQQALDAYRAEHRGGR